MKTNLYMNIKADYFYIYVCSFLNTVVLYVFLILWGFNQSHSIIYGTADKVTTYDEAYIDTDSLSTESLDVISTEGIIPNYDGNQSDYLSIYRKLLVGRYYVYDYYLFDFTIDGAFNGFFDSEEQNVSGYLYEVLEIDNEPILRIINNDKSSYVDYVLKLTSDNKIILKYVNSDSEFSLVRE